MFAVGLLINLILRQTLQIFTHTDESRGSIASIGVCLCVCVSVRTIEPERLKLQPPNLSQG